MEANKLYDYEQEPDFVRDIQHETGETYADGDVPTFTDIHKRPDWSHLESKERHSVFVTGDVLRLGPPHEALGKAAANELLSRSDPLENARIAAMYQEKWYPYGDK